MVLALTIRVNGHSRLKVVLRRNNLAERVYFISHFNKGTGFLLDSSASRVKTIVFLLYYFSYLFEFLTSELNKKYMQEGYLFIIKIKRIYTIRRHCSLYL